MLKNLYNLGKYIDETEGIFTAFRNDLDRPADNDFIATLEIKDKDFEVGVEQASDKTNFVERNKLFYKGGNSSFTSTTGVMGVSPFFFQFDKLEENKINNSYVYDEIYREKIEDKNGLSDNLINNYLDFLINNLEEIKNKIKKISDDKPKWFFVKRFEKEVHDVHFSFISRYLKKPRRKNITPTQGKCDFCKNKKNNIKYPRLPFFSLDIGTYSKSLQRNSIENMRIKICEECEMFIVGGWRYLRNIFDRNYILLPKIKKNKNLNEEHREALQSFFKKINNTSLSDFEKINQILENEKVNKYFELDFLIVDKEQSKLKIKKYIKNYKLHCTSFENLNLLEKNDEDLKFINYKLEGKSNELVNKIEDPFDLEKILHSFFRKENGFFLDHHFYELYYRDLPKKLSSIFKQRLYKYRKDLFNFVYELDFTALNKQIISELVLTCILYEIRNKRKLFENKNYRDLNLKESTLIKINHFYFLTNKIMSDQNFKTKVNNLEEYLQDLNQSNKQKIKDLVFENNDLFYYLIGNMIKKIDSFRYSKNKSKIFETFIKNVNNRNIRKRFVQDILKKQIYYLERLNPKAKFVLSLVKYKLEKLFEESEFEEIMLALISGYYSDDVLKSEDNQ